MIGTLYDPERLAASLEVNSADAFVAFRPPNVRYLTKFTKMTTAAAFVSLDSPVEPVLIVPSADADYVVEDLAPNTNVSGYGEFYRDVRPGEKLAEREELILRIHDATDRTADRTGRLAAELVRAGLESSRLLTDGEAPEIARLTEVLEGADIRCAPEVFKQLRAVKTSQEVDRLKTAAAVTEQAIAETAASMRQGTTQLELERAFKVSVARAGLDLRMANVSVGRSSALGNANVHDEVVESGSVLRFDVGAIAEGYASDVARCFAFLRADSRTVRYHSALVTGQQAALDMMRPGTSAQEIFDVAVRAVREAGIPHYKRTHVGHGIGIHGDGYDPPVLRSTNTALLEAGMVVCVETPYYELGFCGLQVEDMVVVTDSGVEFLTNSPRDLATIR